MSQPRNPLATMAHRVTPTGGPNFFPTQPWAARAGVEIIRRLDPGARSAWECACGMGSMAHGLADGFEVVRQSDLYLYDGNRIHDFLSAATVQAGGPFGPVDWVISNPPFDEIPGFIRQALRVARRGVAMLLPMRALEGVERHGLLYGERCPTVVAPFSERLPMHQGVYDPDRSTAAFYGWFIWLQAALRPRRFMARLPMRDGSFEWRPGMLDIEPGTRKRLTRRSDLRFAVDGPAREIVADRRAMGQAPLAPRDLELLRKVAAEPRGVTPHWQAYPAGLLATLKGMGLVEAGEPDPVFGDRRYSVTEEGRVLLAAVGGGA